jgi:hypothetical protein
MENDWKNLAPPGKDGECRRLYIHIFVSIDDHRGHTGQMTDLGRRPLHFRWRRGGGRGKDLFCDGSCAKGYPYRLLCQKLLFSCKLSTAAAVK